VCGRVCLQRLWPSQRSGGISPNWPSFFIHDLQVCNASLAHYGKVGYCYCARMGAEHILRLRRGRRSSANCGAFLKRRVTNYSVDEFRKKVAEGDHFLTTVLKGSLQFVKGEQRDLDAIAGQ